VSLGGSRHGLKRLCFALAATMLLGGLWHGASWNFVIWGALHGTVLAAERLWREFKPAGWRSLPPWLDIVITFNIVCLSWIFFRAAGPSDALDLLGASAGGGPAMLTPMLLALILFGMSFHFMPRFSIQQVAMRLRALPGPAVGLGVGLVMLVVDSMQPEGVAPFIYYQF